MAMVVTAHGVPNACAGSRPGAAPPSPQAAKLPTTTMFKRFSVAEDVSSQSAIKSSVQRAMKKSIVDQYPAIEEYIDDIIPKKGEVMEGKGKDKLSFILVDGVPLFYHQRDGPYFPTLRLLHKYPIMMPRIQVDVGAISRVMGGANVMAPGITSKGGAILQELPEGAPVAVYAQGKERALAVGFLQMSTDAIRATGKGLAVEVCHHLGDDLWRVLKFE